MFTLTEKIKAGLTQIDPFAKGKNQDPLSNLKSATRWLDSLSGGDVIATHGTILAELKRFNDNLKLASKQQLALLMLLDERSQDLQDTLVQQYLRSSRMSRSIESQLWHAINGLYWEVARGYHVFVMEYSRNAKNHQNEALIPLITLRALRTLGQYLKWRAMRYLQPGQNIWASMHKLYLVAETHSFHQSKLAIYPPDTATFSCESMYLHALMFALANTGTLYPRQLHLVDQWLDTWSSTLNLDNQLFFHQHTFAVDLSADHAARRVRNPAVDKPIRYWGTAKLSHRLEAIQSALREGSPPARLGLSEDSRVSESIDLLDHLQRQWSPLATREQRRVPRERVKHMVEISHGFGSITAQLPNSHTPSHSVYGDSMPYQESQDVAVYGFVTERTRQYTTQTKKPRVGSTPEIERWIMHDESAHGYGATVDTRNKTWLRVGALIAAKPREADAWHLGAVRRLYRLDEESSSVGIETFPETLHLVNLLDKKDSGYSVGGSDSKGPAMPFACLWLAGEDHATLIIDPAHFQLHKVLALEGIPDVRCVSLGPPVERGEGWMRVEVHVAESDV
ncbi:MAG: hypothetical protein ACYC4K_02205 [Thiobacillus sp.]